MIHFVISVMLGNPRQDVVLWVLEYFDVRVDVLPAAIGLDRWRLVYNHDIFQSFDDTARRDTGREGRKVERHQSPTFS